MTSAYSVV
uniref:Uncharacterized protein n=1 Tax=Anguilla anguilla TaxID=7936 RepID=A0A0E9T994_ANGAN